MLFISSLLLCAPTGVAQRVLTLTEDSVLSGPVTPYKGCARISPGKTTAFTFDMSLGSADLLGSTAPSFATHRCGNVQCPSCFLIEEPEISEPISLFIQTCHASLRQVDSSQTVQAHSLCGFKKSFFHNAGSPGSSNNCSSCMNRSESEFCARCIDERVRCFEDCDPLLVSGACDDADAPEDACAACGARPGRRTVQEQPLEGGRQFSYLTDERVIEFVFINNSTQVLMVGSGPDAVYPMDREVLDTNVIVAGTSRSALCYRGRFYWQ